MPSVRIVATLASTEPDKPLRTWPKCRDGSRRKRRSFHGAERERVLVEEPLTVENLESWLQPTSPLSRAVRDGAGFEYRPNGVRCYVGSDSDGWRLAWERKCSQQKTDTDEPHVGHAVIHCTPFTDAFPEGEDGDDDFEDARQAAIKAAYDAIHQHNSAAYEDREAAEDWVADVCELAGSQKPKLRPTPKPAESTAPVVPYPCPSTGYKCGTNELGLPPRPIRQVRGGNGQPIELLIDHDWYVW